MDNLSKDEELQNSDQAIEPQEVKGRVWSGILQDWEDEDYSEKREKLGRLPYLPTTWADMSKELGPISLAWPGWMPKGFLSLLASESGVGKSALLLRLCKSFILQQPWPDGSPVMEEGGCVLWCEAEAAQAINLQRARDWAIPLDHIYAPLKRVSEDINLDELTHRDAIEEWARSPNVRWIVVDSLRGSHHGDEDSSQSVFVLKWLAELARDTGKSITVTHHFRKKGKEEAGEISLDRLRGSSAIPQFARLIWVLDVPDLCNKQVKRLSVIKSNLGQFPTPIGIKIGEGGVDFSDAPKQRQAISPADRGADLLISLLKEGPRPQTEIDDYFERAGIGRRTLAKVKSQLGIESYKDKVKNGAWYWNLQSGGDSQQSPE
jgi:hypothetical protein